MKAHTPVTRGPAPPFAQDGALRAPSVRMDDDTWLLEETVALPLFEHTLSILRLQDEGMLPQGQTAMKPGRFDFRSYGPISLGARAFSAFMSRCPAEMPSAPVVFRSWLASPRQIVIAIAVRPSAIRLASSPSTTSRTQKAPVSIVQCPLTRRSSASA